MKPILCSKCGNPLNAGTALVKTRWDKKSKKERMEVNKMLNEARKAKRSVVLRNEVK